MVLVNSTGNIIVAAGEGPVVPATAGPLVVMSAEFVNSSTVRLQIMTPGVDRVRVRGVRRTLVVDGPGATDVPLALLTRDVTVDPLRLQFAAWVDGNFGGYGPHYAIYRTATKPNPVKILNDPTMIVTGDKEPGDNVVIVPPMIIGASQVNAFQERQATAGTGAITRSEGLWGTIPLVAANQRVRVGFEGRFGSAPFIMRRSGWIEIGAGDVTVVPADSEATTAAELTTRLGAVTNNAGRRWIIDLAPGFRGGDFSMPSNYTRGTTTVQLRSADETNRARFSSFNTNGAKNWELVGLDIWRTSVDAFGFPTSVALDVRDSAGTGTTGQRCVIWDCDIRGGTRGVYGNNNKRMDFMWNNIRGAGMDQVALPSSNTTQAQDDINFTNNLISVLHPNMTFPDQSDFIGYDLTTSCPIDVRRSDQVNGNTYVPNLAGDLVLVTGEMKDVRHPDMLQIWNRCINVRINDNRMIGFNGYTHSIFNQNIQSQNPEYTVGMEYRRNWITSAHIHGIANFRSIDPVLEGNRLERLPGANWSVYYSNDKPNTGLMALGFSNRDVDMEGRYPASRVRLNNNVVPTGRNSGWWASSKVAEGAIETVQSNTAVPTGWADFDVAKGRYGVYGYRNAA